MAATGSGLPQDLLDPAARRREQRSWYVYDWANSAYVTTTLTVLFGPYLTVVAKRAACPGQPSDAACRVNLSVFGVPVATARLVRAVHAAGAQVHVWTVDDPVRIAELFAAGVDAVVTNRADLALPLAAGHRAPDPGRR